MKQRLRIAIIGYGIGGISAAVHLRRLGHCITHFDRCDPPSSGGAGMLLHPPAQRELQHLCVLDDALARGARVEGIRALTIEGRPLFDLAYKELSAGQAALGIQRGTLHRLLSAADAGRDELLAGRNVTSVDWQDGFLHEESGTRHGPYDLVVAADGSESAQRSNLPFTARRDRRATTVALVGLLEDNGFASDRLVQRFDGGTHVSVWPVGSDAKFGGPMCSFAMNVSIEKAAELRDGGGWKDCVARFFPELEGAISAQGNRLRPYVFTYRDIEVGSYSHGRVVLIGDAAHSMSPQLGVGAQMAMADARHLANVIAAHGTVAAALRDYSRMRPPQVGRYQRASRWLTPLLQSESPVLSGLRDSIFAAAMRSPLARRAAQEFLC